MDAFTRFGSTTKTLQTGSLPSSSSSQQTDSHSSGSETEDTGGEDIQQSVAKQENTDTSHFNDGECTTPASNKQQSQSGTPPGETGGILHSSRAQPEDSTGLDSAPTAGEPNGADTEGFSRQTERDAHVYRSAASNTELTCTSQSSRDEYHTQVLSLVTGEITRLTDSFKRHIDLHRQNLLRDLSRHLQTNLPDDILFTKCQDSVYLQKSPIQLPDSSRSANNSKHTVSPQITGTRPKRQLTNPESNGQPVDIWNTVEDWEGSSAAQSIAAQAPPVTSQVTSQHSPANPWSLYPYGRSTRSQAARDRRFQRYHQRVDSSR